MGIFAAKLDKLLGNMVKAAPLRPDQKTKPFHKLPGYKGPKPPSARDRHRAMVRATRANTKAFNRSLAAYERGEGEHPHYQPPTKGTA